MPARSSQDSVMSNLLRFRRCEEANAALEYGIIAALTSLAIVPTLGTLGGKLAGTFGAVSGALDDSGAPPPAPADPMGGGGPPGGNGG